MEVERSLSHNPLTQVMLVLLNEPVDRLVLPDLRVTSIDVDDAATQFDLLLHMWERDGVFAGVLHYSTDLFDPATVERLMRHFEQLLEGAVQQPNARIQELPLLTAPERQQLLVEWNQTELGWAEVCLQRLLEKRAEKTPEAVAVLCEDARLTYGELHRRANQLAHFLRKRGVGPDVLVGICVERSLEMVVGMLGILKAGGAYLPLDPAYPKERLAFMLEDAAAPVLLTQDSLGGQFVGRPAEILCLDTGWSAVAGESSDHPAPVSTPEHLAYVIYTSGSTGQPKGVQVPRRALANFLLSMQERPGLSQQDVLLAVTTLSFDIAGLEIWLPLLAGAQVVIASREVAADGAQLESKINNHGVTCMQATPATWRVLIDSGWRGKRPFKVLCGGEALPNSLAEELLKRCSQLWNMYGPTETTIWSGIEQLRGASGLIPIGRPIANTTFYVLDAALQPVPVGVAGELHIGGTGLAIGYRNRPDLTKEKFIANPFGPGQLYKTGDLVRCRPNGSIEFLGRLDHQVKVRGFRIELGEIETALSRHPAVRESAVLARDDSAGQKQLVAYLVVRGEETPGVAEFRSFLKEALPEHMIPSVFVRLEAFPLTPNGKIDRKALPEPEENRLKPAQGFVSPKTPDEVALARIWREVLGVAQVGVHDSFFDLGGHSLLATQLVSRAKDAFQIDLPLRVLFESPTVFSFCAAIAKARESRAQEGAPQLRAVERGDEVPLSFAQQRFWFIDQLEGFAYNLPGAYRLRGPLDVGLIRESLRDIMVRHESLRTRFPSVAGRAIQVIETEMAVPFAEIDLTHLPPHHREAEALRLANAETGRPLNLAEGPLWRVNLLTLGREDHVLLVTMHHIISDAWSLAVFRRELEALYRAKVQGQPSPLAPLKIQYADFAIWQREWLQGEVLTRQLDYWKTHLEGVPTLLEIPADRPRPPVQTFRGARKAINLPRELSERLKALGRQEGTTLFMTLMAAFQVLLGRYSGQERFIVSTGVANRNRPETEPLMGCLINILLLKADLSGNPAFKELLHRVRECALGAYANQDLPFEQLVEELQPKRDLSYNPLTQVMFVLLNEPMALLELPGVEVETLDLEVESSPYDLVMHLWETKDGLRGFWHFTTDLFDATTIDRMVAHFLVALEAIASEPERRVQELPLLTHDERQRMLFDWNDTRRPFPENLCLHELFEQQAARAPDAPAVVFGEERLSYGELDKHANQLAHFLRKKGVGPDVLVGICVERSLEMVVGMLGIMKAGGAYVPLDPAYPKERLSFMLEDTKAPVLLTQSRLVTLLSQTPAELVCLDGDWEEIAKESAEKPASGVGPKNLSYVIFTSGSTGTPKGISIRHRGVLNNIVDLNWRHGVGPEDRMLALSSLSFDMCVYEVFGTLEAGGAIIMPTPAALREPAQWAELIRQHGVTVWNSAPALLKMLVDYVSDRPELWPSRLHLAILGGDWIPVTLPDRLKVMAPKVRFIALGGATEASIHSIIYTVEKTDPAWKSIPYGRPMYNQKAYILNQALQPAPIGVAGELYLGGIGLGRGYWNRPEQTAERFIPNPFGTEPGERIYRTGDLARYLPDGNIELIGRIDYQVKLRGLRIECGEIEAVLRQHPGVREAVVVAKEFQAGDKRLVGYVRPREETALPVSRLLQFEREGLLEKWQRCELPNGMVVICRNKNETEFGYHEIFEEQGYLRHGIQLTDGDVVFDVGANIGMFALSVGRHCPHATIYSFEPIQPIYQLLELNTRLYGLQVELFNLGLSNNDRSETFTYYPHLSLISGRFADGAAERETVKSFLLNEHKLAQNDPLLDELLAERLQTEQVTCQMRTLSQVIRENGVQRIDLLKIDVEKSEQDVLAGIEDEHWPLIRQLVVEVHDSGGKVGRISALLESKGYRVGMEQDSVLKDTPYRNVYAWRGGGSVSIQQSGGPESAAPESWQWASPERLGNDIRGFVKSKLPDYMVPTAVVLMDELPLSPNGKVDRKLLSNLETVVAKPERVYVGPRSMEEEVLANICGKVLGLEKVGVSDNFFELGGHSLLATQVISQIREAFQVELPLRALFESPTVAGLAERILSAQGGGSSLQAPPLVPVARDRHLPLSFAQQRLWFIDQLLPGSSAYSIPFGFFLSGPLNGEALERSLREIVRRHEALRTCFPTVDGEPRQEIRPPETFRLEKNDLRHWTGGDREKEAARLGDEEAQRPFSLAEGPLFRARLVQFGDERHLLLLTMHHIIMDGWSLDVFLQELSRLYDAFDAGQPSPLEPLPIQYADYAVWQRQWLQGRVLEAQMKYWKEQLAGAPPKLELPADHARPAVQTLRGARYIFTLPRALAEAAEALSREEGSTVFMTLLAAFKTFLYAYAQEEDIVVGSPFANRTRLETQPLIGSFVNTLVLRTRLEGNPTFRQLLARVREVILGADAHQDLPLEKIVEALRPPRDPSRNPLFQVNFRVITSPLFSLKLPKVNPTLRISDTIFSKFDLALELWVNAETFGGFFEYSTDLFNEDTIKAMSQDFEEMLRELLTQPDKPLRSLTSAETSRQKRRAREQAQQTQRQQQKKKGLQSVRRKGIQLG